MPFWDRRDRSRKLHPLADAIDDAWRKRHLTALRQAVKDFLAVAGAEAPPPPLQEPDEPKDVLAGQTPGVVAIDHHGQQPGLITFDRQGQRCAAEDAWSWKWQDEAILYFTAQAPVASRPVSQAGSTKVDPAPRSSQAQVFVGEVAF
jgi:hypothetical protein